MAIAVAGGPVLSSAGDATSYTTASIDTTGATLLVVILSGQSAGTWTVTDSKSNTGWTSLTQRTDANGGRSIIAYCQNPSSVGSSHTFTISSTAAIYGGIGAIGFSGTKTSGVFDSESGASSLSGASFQPGSITPSANGALLFFASGGFSNAVNLSSVSVGTISHNNTGTSAVDYGFGAAYYVQTTAAAINPTLTPSASGNGHAVMACFLEAAASSTYTMSSPTYTSLTSTTVLPRVTVTVA